MNISRDATTESNRSSDDELTRRAISTETFLETCVLDADDKALKEHLVCNPVQQSELDRCLLRGLRIVQRKERELSHIAQSLTILLQHGAKWNSDTLLDDQKTPYHVICESPGDHHKLLDMMIKSSQKTVIDARDYRMFTALMHAMSYDNTNCFKCLVENGADVTGNHSDGYVWSLVARLGNVEMLKCMFNHGADKDSTDQDGFSVLWWVIYSGKIETVRYLLDIGVAIPNSAPEELEAQCERCKENILIIEDMVQITRSEDDINIIEDIIQKEDQDPCTRAIRDNKLEIVKLLDERGSQSCKSFTALRCAVIWGSVYVASYLLNKYSYPLNMEYMITDSDQNRYESTLLTEPRYKFTAEITKLLLDHGADPAKPMCAVTSLNAIMTAIHYGNVEAVAQYIRSGVDINFRSWHGSNKKYLPFETAVLYGRQSVVKVLLIAGCSCGLYSLYNNHKFKDNLQPEVENLMKEWDVYLNNVSPLQQRCRSVILNHLSPRADMKIWKLPLPGLVIKFLSLPELDAILD